MTNKDQLQKELKEKQRVLYSELSQKVKEGVKPSDLKKLKRSKSEGDLPNPPQPKSTPLTRTNSNQRSILELKLETKDRELQEKDEVIQSKDNEIKKFKEKLTNTTQQLDNCLQSRVEALKAFAKSQEKLKSTKKELAENIEQASEEINNQDEIITKLRNEQLKVQQRIEELEKDLNLAHRLNKLKDYSLPNKDN